MFATSSQDNLSKFAVSVEAINQDGRSSVFDQDRHIETVVVNISPAKGAESTQSKITITIDPVNQTAVITGLTHINGQPI